MKYPKIETLFDRDDKFKVMEGEYRLPEFNLINAWWITEKIDGTNIRVRLFPQFSEGNWTESYQVRFFGRTDKAELHPNLTKYLEETFTSQKLDAVFNEFSPNITLFGEGYGPKIQRGGNYRSDISFRLFDVYIEDGTNPLGGWWLEVDHVKDIARALNIETVPSLGVMTAHEAVLYVKDRVISIVSQLEGGNPEYLAEGIVARSKPLLFTRRGRRVMWKLKAKDFAV